MLGGNRTFLGGFFGVLLAVLGSVGVINYVVDPFHYYRGVNSLNHVFFPAYERYENVGLARSFRYDTVVTGSSVTENFLSSYVERIWGGKAMKLAISGSVAHEQYLILKQAIRTGQVRRVLWGLDAGAFYGGADRVRDDQAPFPYFMYRDPPILNVEYPLSFSTLHFSLIVLRGWGQTDLDTLDTWYKEFKYGPPVVLETWSGSCADFSKKYRRSQSALPQEALREMRASVRQNLVSLIQKNPQVKFYLFFPPVTLLMYIPAQDGDLNYSLPMRSFIAHELAHLPNVEFFDFQTVPVLTEDLSRYKDMMHYDLATSEYLIRAMHDGRWRVGPRQLVANNQLLIDEVNAYDPCRGHGPLAAQIANRALP